MTGYGAVSAVRLTTDDILHLKTGSIFNSCTADPDWCAEETQRVLAHMEAYDTGPELCDVGDLDDDALVVSVGFVNNGIPMSDLRPVGDEFVAALRVLEESLGRPVQGIFPLAAGSANALIPLLVGMQTDLPIVDADPMGRIFPLVNQTVFTLAGLPVGPVAAAGATGESAVVNVSDPLRAERILRALAGEYGGWAATATYPMAASTLARTGVLGSITRLIRMGQILDSPLETEQKHDALRRAVGVKQILRARVGDGAWLARPATPGEIERPASVVLVEESQGRLVQLEVKNEMLMMMVDGAVRAVVPDIITMMRPLDGGVATLDDLWTGNVVDIVVMPAATPWYTPEGLRLGGPTALNLFGAGGAGRRTT
ncbi:DUF917 domain-containing protein [Microbacterium capsulatum]|uniref:DUF917 domain-containing protein n=1 Tax=Microbacterium capsulatum TaxID=3041921 RepID=A0ABU0XKD8_9MICO|nr:DUF917 domain-containing protein [Microbacterium sp. ASV81]MDQ4215605.1 DUF917 domain-containing protein [Microbacterium sp. ASV81]